MGTVSKVSPGSRHRKTTVPLDLRGAMASSRRGRPPPQATTSPSRRASSSATPRSSSRKRSSPWAAKISGMLRPSRAAIRASVSTSSRSSRRESRPPQVVLPQPIIPIRIMFFILSHRPARRNTLRRRPPCNCPAPGNPRPSGRAPAAPRPCPGRPGRR